MFHTDLAFVWIGSFGVDSTVVYDVLECQIHVSTFASMVGRGAVDQILLAERYQGIGTAEMLSFDGSGLGK